jgi:hypothetical protein
MRTGRGCNRPGVAPCGRLLCYRVESPGYSTGETGMQLCSMELTQDCENWRWMEPAQGRGQWRASVFLGLCYRRACGTNGGDEE